MRRLICLVALAALAGPSAALAAGGCKSFSGTFTAVPPPTCAGAICTHGTLAGGLPSTYDFTATALFPVAPPEFGYVGHSTITLAHGGAQLFGSDSGHIDLATGQFVTAVQIVGGTKQYAGATGEIVAPGTLDLATGTTVGTYSGYVCKAQEEDED